MLNWSAKEIRVQREVERHLRGGWIRVTERGERPERIYMGIMHDIDIVKVIDLQSCTISPIYK